MKKRTRTVQVWDHFGLLGVIRVQPIDWVHACCPHQAARNAALRWFGRDDLFVFPAGNVQMGFIPPKPVLS